MKTILVTGGAGFLGINLCERLLRDDNKIICVDNFYCSSKKNINKLTKNKNFQLIQANVIDAVNINCKVDEIYNLACPASPQHYQKDPIFTTKTCIFGALNMLDLANKNNAKIMQASTSEVYGDPTIHPQHEGYFGNVNPIGIRSCYDEGKRCAESLFYDYNRMYNTKIKIARVHNTSGPYMMANDGRVVSNFIIQCLQNKQITVYGDGTQTRSFCYVDDMIDGFIKLMASLDEVKGPINLGNPGEYKVIELAEIIKKLTGSKSEIVFRDLPQDDPKVRRPDITKAKKILGWEPKVKLEDGLIKTIEYFEKELKGRK